MNKKAISPIVAISLLIIVAVLAVISFQKWYFNFSSQMIVGVENQNISNDLKIDKLVGTKLYLRNIADQNITISSIKIGNKNCIMQVQNISPGLHGVEINNCIHDVFGTVSEILVISDQNIYSKSLYFEEDIADIVPESTINSIIDDFSLGNLDNIQIYNDNLVLDENSGEYLQTGNYTSKVYDAGALANWDNLNIEYSLSNKFIPSEVKNNLVVYYSFNGNADDELENFDGSVVSANLMAGVVNQCYNFDKNLTYIDLPSNILPSISNNNFSINFWIKSTYVGGLANIMWLPSVTTNLNPWTGINFFLNRNGLDTLENSITARLDRNNYVNFVDDSISNGNWHMITFMRTSPTSIRIYLNGILKNSKIVSDIDVSQKYVSRVAYNVFDDPNQQYFGGLDELGIWDRVLTDEEVTQLYNSGKGLNYLEPTNLTLQIRTSNDNVIWSEWTDKSLLNTEISDSARYFQFRFLFETTDITSTPILNKISFDYELN